MLSRLVCLLTFLSAAAIAEAGGSIEGTVKIDGPAPRRPPLVVTKDESACGKQQPNESALVGEGGALKNVVVFLKDAKPPARLEPSANARIDQRGCVYQPHVQSVTIGTQVTILNNDAVLHNVHGNLGPVTVFNIAMPIRGQKLPVKFSRPGIVRLQCDAGHTWMNAYVYVLEHPWHAVTDARGVFRLDDVPAGTHRLELWHESADGKGPGATRDATVTVTDGVTARADLTMKL